MAENTCLFEKLDTGRNADSVEFCPYEGQQDILLCGTYKLKVSSNQQPTNDEETVKQVTQTRVGGVNVYKLSSTDGDPQLSLISQHEMCGVLDIKWPEMKINSNSLFGLVDAEGYCQIFELTKEDSQLIPVSKEMLSELSLGLSLSWDGGQERSSSKLAASDSKGCVTVFETGEGSLTQSSRWLAHDYEAWITAFHNFDSNIVYTGGDDCTLKGWDLRDISKPTFVSRKHTMGVCSIQSHPFDENIYATGSYDEDLLVWDRRKQRQPLSSVNLGGGVWRIKWDPFFGQYLLTATMYNGTHIINYHHSESSSSLQVVAEHGGHNLAYGADWCRLDKNLSSVNVKENCSNFLVSTCSFYDNSLHLWEWVSDIK